jgi:hypothetical protein
MDGVINNLFLRLGVNIFSPVLLSQPWMVRGRHKNTGYTFKAKGAGGEFLSTPEIPDN